MAVELENMVIRQIASLCWHDPTYAGGLFTQGGTFCNLYGYLFGLRKTFPMFKFEGIAGRSFCMFNESGHYSNMTNLALMESILAINTDSVSIETTKFVSMTSSVN